MAPGTDHRLAKASLRAFKNLFGVPKQFAYGKGTGRTRSGAGGLKASHDPVSEHKRQILKCYCQHLYIPAHSICIDTMSRSEATEAEARAREPLLEPQHRENAGDAEVSEKDVLQKQEEMERFGLGAAFQARSASPCLVPCLTAASVRPWVYLSQWLRCTRSLVASYLHIGSYPRLHTPMVAGPAVAPPPAALCPLALPLPQPISPRFPSPTAPPATFAHPNLQTQIHARICTPQQGVPASRCTRCLSSAPHNTTRRCYVT